MTQGREADSGDPAAYEYNFNNNNFNSSNNLCKAYIGSRQPRTVYIIISKATSGMLLHSEDHYVL